MKKIYLILLLLALVNFSKAQQWQQFGTLMRPDSTSDHFGYSISMNGAGNIVAVGSYESDVNGTNSGKTEIFKNINGEWEEIGDDIIGEASSDLSGYCVSINNDGTILAIGAPGNGDISFCGNVRIFQYTNNNWVQLGSNIDGEVWDLSGSPCAISGDGQTVIIAAPTADYNGDNNTGKVKIYKYISGNWTQIGSTIYGDNAYDELGNSISINYDGNIIAVGSEKYDNFRGIVKTFEYNGSDWQQIGNDLIGNTEGVYFGKAVKLNYEGTKMVIGVPYSSEGANNAGQMKVFKYESGSWTQIGNDINGDISESYMGNLVSIDSLGNTVAFSSFYSSNTKVYENTGNQWQLKANAINEHGVVCLNNTGNSIAIPGYDTTAYVKVFQYDESTYIKKTIAQAEIIVYPNPADNYITIVSNENIFQTNKNIQITDITGKVLINVIANEVKQSVDISNLQKGIYIVSIGHQRIKFIKK